MAKSKASSLSSAEVRRLWEEPAEETGLTSGSVGILAIYGGEDVNLLMFVDAATTRCQINGFSLSSSACKTLRDSGAHSASQRYPFFLSRIFLPL